MLVLNKNMINEIKKDVIKFFKFIHKKINLYKFSSIYFYYIYFLYFISNINNFKVNRFKVNNFYNANNLKYLLKLNYIYYLKFNNMNININLGWFIKIYLLNILKFKTNYFCTNYDVKVISSFNYKLMLNLWYFMLYGKYIVYMVTYLYNLYLNTKCYLIKFPLINIMLRFLLRSRLDKLIYFKKYKYSKYKFIEKYNIYDIKYKVNILYNFILKFNFNRILFNFNIFKVLNLLSNKKIYIYLNFLWYKYIKINYLYLIYYFNIYNDYDNSLACEYNKFNILGIFSFYWQLKRYGFNVNYYFYYFSILYFKFFNINDYNYCFYNSLIYKNKHVNIFWYKINKIIVLNYIRRSFFRYIKLNRLILRNKLRRKLIIKKWLFFSKIYNMKFYPLNYYLYDDNNISHFITFLIKKINYLHCLNLFNFIYKYYNKYTVNLIDIINKINININISINFYYFQNYLVNLIVNKIKKYYYINILNLLCCLNVLCKNIIDKVNLRNVIAYKKDKDLNKNLNLYLFYKLKGLNKFFELYFFNINNYLWYFEKSIMFNMFVKYMYHFYLFFFSVFSCYIKLNINIFNSIKLNKNNYIINK